MTNYAPDTATPAHPEKGGSAPAAEGRALLSLLAHVGASGATSQRSLAAHIGAALGLTNALLKRCVRKGLIKVREAPARRFIYYLTPTGFAEKSRLTAEYVSTSLGFFRSARSEYAAIFEQCRARGLSRVVIYGAGDLADIARLAAQEADVAIMGIVVPGTNEAVRQGLPAFPVLPACDAVVLTEMTDAQQSFEALRQVMEEERVLTPALLHVTR